MSADWLGILRALASGLLLLGGAGFLLVGAIGLIRMPDFYTRLHAAGVTDTGGAILVLGGLMVQAGPSMAMIKLLLILVFFLLTSPTGSHALASAAYAAGARPVLAEDRTAAEDGGPPP